MGILQRGRGDCAIFGTFPGLRPMFERLSLAESTGSARLGKVGCQLCSFGLSRKGAILKDHCLGKSVRQDDATCECRPGPYAERAAVAGTAARPEPQLQMQTQPAH